MLIIIITTKTASLGFTSHILLILSITPQGKNIVVISLVSIGVREVPCHSQVHTVVAGKAGIEVQVSDIPLLPYVHFHVHVCIMFIFTFVFQETSEIVWKQIIKRRAVPNIHMFLSH